MDPVCQAIREAKDARRYAADADLSTHQQQIQSTFNALMMDLKLRIQFKHFDHISDSYVEISTGFHKSCLPERFRGELDRRIRAFLSDFLRSEKRVEILSLICDQLSITKCFSSYDAWKWMVKARLLNRPNESSRSLGPCCFHGY